MSTYSCVYAFSMPLHNAVCSSEVASPYSVTVPWLIKEICFQADERHHDGAIMHLIGFSVICINVIWWHWISQVAWSQSSFITLSLSFFLDVCHYFRTYSSSSFLFIFFYPSPLTRVSTHLAERSALGPDFGYHDALFVRHQRQIPERRLILRRRQGFLPHPFHFIIHKTF